MRILKKLLLLLCIIVVIIGVGMTLQGYQIYKEAIEEISLSDKKTSVQSEDSYTTVQNLPEDYLNAVVSVEDRRFYEHGAVDVRSIGRAIVTNIKERELTEGGSTITQQLAKNLYFSQKKELSRKIAEIFMAFEMEKQYTKEEILELYINTSYFGEGYYGIAEASQGYFNKVPSKMSLKESTLLAGVPNAPSVYNPVQSPTLSKKRQKHVINSMVENKYLTQEEAAILLKE